MFRGGIPTSLNIFPFVALNLFLRLGSFVGIRFIWILSVVESVVICSPT